MPGNSTAGTAPSPFVKLRYAKNRGKHLIFDKLSLDLPLSGQRLIHNFTLVLDEGERLVITGPSGSGKSTLFRAIRGLWKQGEGAITIPEKARILCLSQRVDLPNTFLRGILASPRLERDFADQEIDDALRDVQHDRLRIHLPSNQVKVSHLCALAEKHSSKVLEHWCRTLATLPDPQRHTVVGYIKAYIAQHAGNFFDHKLSPYLTTDAKKELGERLSSRLEKALSRQLPFLGVSVMRFRTVRSQGLAISIAKYLLQGIARDIRNSQLDGSDFVRQLSAGEQQRLMFARILLHKPDIILMDEATAALDRKSGETLYALITERLPRAIIISIAHDTHLIRYHTHHGHLENSRIRLAKISSAFTPSAAGSPCVNCPHNVGENRWRERVDLVAFG